LIKRFILPGLTKRWQQALRPAKSASVAS